MPDIESDAPGCAELLEAGDENPPALEKQCYSAHGQSVPKKIPTPRWGREMRYTVRNVSQRTRALKRRRCPGTPEKMKERYDGGVKKSGSPHEVSLDGGKVMGGRGLDKPSTLRD